MLWRRIVLDVLAITLGLTALLMRQTNVFWVVIYMGGREAVDAVESLSEPPLQAYWSAGKTAPGPPPTPRFASIGEMVGFYFWRWWAGDVHDPPLNLAWPDGMCLRCVATAVARF